MEILFKHVSQNVLLPLVTKLGMSLPMLVTGAVITETIFSWPGIGNYFVERRGRYSHQRRGIRWPHRFYLIDLTNKSRSKEKMDK